jgi:hypothetical protein
MRHSCWPPFQRRAFSLKAAYSKQKDRSRWHGWRARAPEEANDVIADYLKRKIRSIVNDPATADKLTPKTYPYGTKRQPVCAEN